MDQLKKTNESTLGLISALLLVLGIFLLLWAWQDIKPAQSAGEPTSAASPSPADGSDIAANEQINGNQAQTDDPSPVEAKPQPVDQAKKPSLTSRLGLAQPLQMALLNPTPPELEIAIQNWLDAQPKSSLIADASEADLWLTTEPVDNPVAERIYVPVKRFASLDVEADPAQLLGLWLGGPKEGEQALVVTPDAAAGLFQLWGPPAEIEVVHSAEALAALLEENDSRLGVLPFDQLLPQVNALAINGEDPTNNRFNLDTYPLVLRFYLAHQPDAEQLAGSLRTYLKANGSASNRDPAKLTSLIMTGVTAMSRVTAARMEAQGYQYPAEEVGPELAAADLTHISNEVPFFEGCQVNAAEGNVTLCSKPGYIEALRAIGVDLIGLTGNHLNDFGRQASEQSMAFFSDEGIPTFGGGVNLAQSLEPLVMEHNGNRLVFLGANSFGPQLAWAEPDWPGSAPYDFDQMAIAIREAREDLGADLVLLDMQWEESYDSLPIQSQLAGFQQLSSAGADIVTGVQSHVPQAIGFGDGGLILYGLGNFFFDQMWSLPTREGLIPRHTIYDGRHISTEILTTILEDYAQPRWAAESERETLLNRIFAASGW
ncbi:MAG: CapA family protein [Chloroflexota bacterium]|nr:CapA family protein [Chloroflexota bacterium]